MRRARHAGQRHVLHRLRREDARGRTRPARKASNAAIMAHQIAPKIHTYPVSRVEYARHPGRDGKAGFHARGLLQRPAPRRQRVGLLRAWRVCGRKGARWWIVIPCRRPEQSLPKTTEHALTAFKGLEPPAITVNESGKYPEIIRHHWEPINEPGPTQHQQRSLEEITSVNSNASPQAATAACTWAPAKSASNSTPNRRPTGRAGQWITRMGI